MLKSRSRTNGHELKARSTLEADEGRRLDEALDDALAHSFPASDTPSMLRPGRKRAIGGRKPTGPGM
jgi:hypothetical protein